MRIEMNVTFGFEEMWHMIWLQDRFDGQEKREELYANIVSENAPHPSNRCEDEIGRMQQERDWARQMDRRLFMAIQEGKLCSLLARYEGITQLWDFSKKALGQTIQVDDIDTDGTVELMNEQCAIDSVEESLRRIFNRGFDPDPNSNDEQERKDAALLDYLRLTRARHQAALPAFEEAAVRDMSPIAPSHINIIPASSGMDTSDKGNEDFNDPFWDE